jgi:outer membrane protein OmpA-like peptidoglycan-associated protein
MRRLAARLAAVLGLLLCIAACASSRPASQKFVVYFEAWSASLDDAGRKGVGTAARWAKEHPGQIVTVSGFADPKGGQQANIDMSRTRAQVVLDQLVRDGVDRNRIRLAAHGPTDYTLTSLESRRVEIGIAGL